jgi:hypothetical protein
MKKFGDLNGVTIHLTPTLHFAPPTPQNAEREKRSPRPVVIQPFVIRAPVRFPSDT